VDVQITGHGPKLLLERGPVADPEHDGELVDAVEPPRANVRHRRDYRAEGDHRELYETTGGASAGFSVVAAGGEVSAEPAVPPFGPSGARFPGWGPWGLRSRTPCFVILGFESGVESLMSLKLDPNPEVGQNEV
jgi:hypothetical protein